VGAAGAELAPLGPAASTNLDLSAWTNDFKFSLWNQEFSVRSGMGYKDNVTLSSSAARGSGYWVAGGEVMVFRLPSGGWNFSAFGSFLNLGYFDKSTGVNNEQSGLALAQVTKDLGSDWKMGLSGTYLYQDQVLDVSAAETSQFTIGEVLGHTAIGRWFVRKDFKPWWVEAEASVTRQWLASPLDSFWQAGPRLTLGRSYGHGSELAVSYQYSRLAYDSRTQVDELGQEIPDTALRFQSQGGELGWHQVWDSARHWQTLTKLGADLNRDNAAGYFDFWQYHLTEQARFRAGTWEITAQGRLAYYDYPVQTITVGDLTAAFRRKIGLSAGVGVQKNLSKKLIVFGSYSYDRSLSNAPDDQYVANSVQAGLEFRF